jgi:hypothetical protein
MMDDAQTLTSRARAAARLLRTASASGRRGREAWRGEAACIGFARQMSATQGLAAQQALARCWACPVVEDCLRWAESETSFSGVAGGRVFQPRSVERRDRATSRDDSGRP